MAPQPQPEPAPAVQETPAAVADETATPDTAVDADDAAAAEAAIEFAKLPKVTLTSDLLYKLMKAELDFREGNWKEPYTALLEAAKVTRDPRLPRRAAEMALSVNEHQSAMAAVSTWRALAPDSEEAARAYLGLAVLTDKLPEAEAILKQRLADAVGSPGTELEFAL